ncbi:hypothetical protein ACWDA8_09585, partial [Streptomyces sp. NPDC001130]
FDEGLYKTFAGMDNQSFNTVRNALMSQNPDDVQAPGQAIYQLDITADGRFVADGDGPKEVNGYFLVRTVTGDAPNPLWQFDGTVDLLPATAKG